MWVFAPIALAFLAVAILLWMDRSSVGESTRDSSGGPADPDAKVDTQP